MLNFVMNMLREQVEHLDGRALLEQKIRAIAEAESDMDPTVENEKMLARANAEAAELKRAVEVATKNLLLVEDDGLRADMMDQYSKLKQKLVEAEERVSKLSDVTTVSRSTDEEVERALALYDNIMRVTTDPAARTDIQPLFASLGLNIGLNFTEGEKGPKRKIRQLKSGVISFNNTLFEKELGRGGGRHGRNDSEPGRNEKTSMSASRSTNKPREGISYTKGNRGGQI